MSLLHFNALEDVGVPRSLHLGSMLFSMYMQLFSIFTDLHSITHHSFADNLQLQMSAPLTKFCKYFFPKWSKLNLCVETPLQSMP